MLAGRQVIRGDEDGAAGCRSPVVPAGKRLDRGWWTVSHVESPDCGPVQHHVSGPQPSFHSHDRRIEARPGLIELFTPQLAGILVVPIKSMRGWSTTSSTSVSRSGSVVRTGLAARLDSEKHRLPWLALAGCLQGHHNGFADSPRHADGNRPKGSCSLRGTPRISPGCAWTLRSRPCRGHRRQEHRWPARGWVRHPRPTGRAP